MIKNIIILGLDPGLADTGFGIIQKSGREIRYLDAGSIQTSKNTDFGARLQEIYQAVDKLIKKYQPDLVAVEKLFFARNVTTALSVGQARGVIMLVAHQNKRPIVEFTPLQVKQAITSSGAAGKRQVGLMVKAILKLRSVPTPDDASDALAIAICASFFNKKLANS